LTPASPIALTIRSPSASVTAMGFSSMKCFPAAAPVSTRSTWVKTGVSTATISTSLSVSTSVASSATRAPVSSAASRARSSSGSYTQTHFSREERSKASLCRCHTSPHPKTPIPYVFIVRCPSLYPARLHRPTYAVSQQPSMRTYRLQMEHRPVRGVVYPYAHTRIIRNSRFAVSDRTQNRPQWKTIVAARSWTHV